MSGLNFFGEDIWIVEGPKVRDTGVWFTTRMTVVRLGNGGIWIESPVPVSFETLKSITELGPVKYLVAATPRHVWRLNSAHTLFPDAQLWACRHTSFTLQQGKLPITGFLSEYPVPDWADDFEQLPFMGNPLLSEVLFFHKKSHTVILGDLIQNNQKIEGKLFTNLVFKLGGVSYPNGGVGRDIRMTFVKRKLARQSLKRFLSWDFDKLILAHGNCIVTGARSFVEKKFRWLEQ